MQQGDTWHPCVLLRVSGDGRASRDQTEELASAFRTGLAVQVFEVVPHCVGTDPQLLGHGRGRQAAAEKMQDLLLAAAELIIRHKNLNPDLRFRRGRLQNHQDRFEACRIRVPDACHFTRQHEAFVELDDPFPGPSSINSGADLVNQNTHQAEQRLPRMTVAARQEFILRLQREQPICRRIRKQNAALVIEDQNRVRCGVHRTA